MIYGNGREGLSAMSQILVKEMNGVTNFRYRPRSRQTEIKRCIATNQVTFSPDGQDHGTKFLVWLSYLSG